jgi:hypothetical protein
MSTAWKKVPREIFVDYINLRVQNIKLFPQETFVDYGTPTSAAFELASKYR